jgi:hypothetical protein
VKSDFLDDLSEKKIVARSAYNKVGNSRKVAMLPSDNLTDAQLAQLSGPVTTYKMRPDVTPEELATWPKDLQKMWRKKFGGDAE